MHVSYGFRALCHAGAEIFPEISNVREELQIISQSITGAATSGGNCLRLLVGFHFLLDLYFRGIIGNKGTVFKNVPDLTKALALLIPTNAGGFGVPVVHEMFTNLAGH